MNEDRSSEITKLKRGQISRDSVRYYRVRYPTSYLANFGPKGSRPKAIEGERRKASRFPSDVPVGKVERLYSILF